MQIRSSKNSCMEKENRLYSISLGVASLQGGSVGVATALSPATCRPFQVFSPSFFVGLGLTLTLSPELVEKAALFHFIQETPIDELLNFDLFCLRIDSGKLVNTANQRKMAPVDAIA